MDMADYPQTWRFAVLLVAGLSVAGCTTPKPGLTPPAAVASNRSARVDDSWLDSVVPVGQQHVFTSDQAYLAIGRTEQAVRFQVRSQLWPTPLLVLWADSPDGPPLAFQPRWSNLVYYTIGRPYRIDLTYPQFRLDQPQAEVGGDPGSVTYHMTDQTKRDTFTANMVAYTSPTHLVMELLGPLPPGQSRVLAARKGDRDYWATLDASPDGRRILKFPCALVWSDFTEAELGKVCTFDVEDVRDWPRTAIRTGNLARTGPVSVSYARTEKMEE
jgi:hypothetical protein